MAASSGYPQSRYPSYMAIYARVLPKKRSAIAAAKLKGCSDSGASQYWSCKASHMLRVLLAELDNGAFCRTYTKGSHLRPWHFGR